MREEEKKERKEGGIEGGRKVRREGGRGKRKKGKGREREGGRE